MSTEKLKLKDIKTEALLIVNTNPPVNDEDLQLKIRTKIDAVADGFVCTISIAVYKEAEADADKKTFQIKYEVSATLNSSEEVESVESIQDEAVALVFPFVRANLAALTSITCPSAITLPCLDM